MIRKLILVAVTGVVGLAASAQEIGLPRGKWWKNERAARQLRLTPDQVDRLDGIATEAARRLIDLRAEAEKATITLRDELDRDEIDREAVTRAVEILNEARGAMFEQEVLTLVSIRGVLTSEQWGKLRDHLHNERRDRRQMMERRRRGGPGPR